MPGIDDRLRRDLERLAKGAEATGSLERVAERRRRHHSARRMQTAVLVVVVLAASAGGGYALTRAFDFGDRDEASAPPVENGLIAFDRFAVGGGSDIWVVDTDGTGLRNLTSTADASERDPAWSPDGTRIAFVRDEDGNEDVYVMDADGSNIERLTNHREDEFDPAWSPGGAKIAFVRGSGREGGRIFVMDPDGSDPAQVTSSEASPGDSQPSWSPDGDELAFTRTDVARRQVSLEGIWVIGVDGTAERKVTDPSSDPTSSDAYPVWSPDGSSILFTRGIGFDSVMHVVDLDTGEVVSLTGAPREGVIRSPQWSPDGRFIVFRHSGFRSEANDVWIMNADGTGRSRALGLHLLNNPILTLAWQPVPLGGPPIQPTTPVPTTPITSPSPTETAPPLEIRLLQEFGTHFDPLCGTAVTGDFDGSGELDLAGAAFPLQGDSCPAEPGDQSWSLYVVWNDLSGGAWPLPECDRACGALSAADLDEDGSDEFFLVSDEGASTRFVRVLGAPLDPLGPVRYTVGTRGPGRVLRGNKPIVMELGGSVTHQAFITCDEAEGEHHVITTVAELTSQQTEWAVVETYYLFDTSTVESELADEGDGEATAFYLLDINEYTVPFDPTGEEPLPVPGNACFVLD